MRKKYRLRLSKGFRMRGASFSRDAFLEFLRNLTPQALLCTAALVVLSSLKPNDSFGNFVRMSVGLIVILIVISAALANMWKFIESSPMGEKWAKKIWPKIRKSQLNNVRGSLVFFRVLVCRRPLFFIKYMIAVLVVYTCFAMVLLMSVNSWINLAK